MSDTDTTPTPNAKSHNRMTRKFHSARRTKRKAPPYAKSKKEVSIATTEDADFQIANTSDEAPVTSKTCDEQLAGTVSHSKINPITVDNENDEEILTSNRMIDMDILSSLFNVVACPMCHSTGLMQQQIKKQGSAFNMKLTCNNSECEWEYEYWTSKKKPKSRNFEVNGRIYYSMRRIGKGYGGLKRFLYLLNHPPPMTKNNYGKIAANFHKAAKHVSEDSLQFTCEQIRNTKININEEAGEVVTVGEEPTLVDTGVTVDGTWQRRGYSSLNGAVAAISIDYGRILDIHVMRKFCQLCNAAEKTRA